MLLSIIHSLEKSNIYDFNQTKGRKKNNAQMKQNIKWFFFCFNKNANILVFQTNFFFFVRSFHSKLERYVELKQTEKKNVCRQFVKWHTNTYQSMYVNYWLIRNANNLCRIGWKSKTNSKMTNHQNVYINLVFFSAAFFLFLSYAENGSFYVCGCVSFRIAWTWVFAVCPHSFEFLSI